MSDHPTPAVLAGGWRLPSRPCLSARLRTAGRGRPLPGCSSLYAFGPRRGGACPAEPSRPLGPPRMTPLLSRRQRGKRGEAPGGHAAAEPGSRGRRFPETAASRALRRGISRRLAGPGKDGASALWPAVPFCTWRRKDGREVLGFPAALWPRVCFRRALRAWCGANRAGSAAGDSPFPSPPPAGLGSGLPDGRVEKHSEPRILAAARKPPWSSKRARAEGREGGREIVIAILFSALGDVSGLFFVSPLNIGTEIRGMVAF